MRSAARAPANGAVQNWKAFNGPPWQFREVRGKARNKVQSPGWAMLPAGPRAGLYQPASFEAGAWQGRAGWESLLGLLPQVAEQEESQ